ncbi:MAG: hypothetical protein WC797_01010 [Candidatus Paceibacterota bacterium]|jgi:hypothetical protein
MGINTKNICDYNCRKNVIIKSGTIFKTISIKMKKTIPLITNLSMAVLLIAAFVCLAPNKTLAANADVLTAAPKIDLENTSLTINGAPGPYSIKFFKFTVDPITGKVEGRTSTVTSWETYSLSIEGTLKRNPDTGWWYINGTFVGADMQIKGTKGEYVKYTFSGVLNLKGVSLQEGSTSWTDDGKEGSQVTILSSEAKGMPDSWQLLKGTFSPYVNLNIGGDLRSRLNNSSGEKPKPAAAPVKPKPPVTKPVTPVPPVNDAGNDTSEDDQEGVTTVQIDSSDCRTEKNNVFVQKGKSGYCACAPGYRLVEGSLSPIQKTFGAYAGLNKAEFPCEAYIENTGLTEYSNENINEAMNELETSNDSASRKIIEANYQKGSKAVKIGIIKSGPYIMFTVDGIHFYNTVAEATNPSLTTRAGRGTINVISGGLSFFPNLFRKPEQVLISKIEGQMSIDRNIGGTIVSHSQLRETMTAYFSDRDSGQTPEQATSGESASRALIDKYNLSTVAKNYKLEEAYQRYKIAKDMGL